MPNHPQTSKKAPKKAVFGPRSEGDCLWDIADCAKYLKLKEDALRALVRQNRVPHMRIFGEKGIRFVPEVVRRWAVDESMENYTPQEVAL